MNKQREIKFRAWNLADKKWNKVSDVFGMNDYFGNLGNGIIRFKRGDVVLMQYTGLKDKNGREIYEGDIIRVLERDWCSKPENDDRTIDQYMLDISSIAEVVFDDGSFKLVSRIEGCNYHSEYAGYTSKRDIFEVIGNIYENKELLQ